VNNKNFSYEMLETATILLNSAIWFFLFIIVFIFIEKATFINIIIWHRKTIATYYIF
jgi:hypothetical protein